MKKLLILLIVLPIILCSCTPSGYQANATDSYDDTSSDGGTETAEKETETDETAEDDTETAEKESETDETTEDDTETAEKGTETDETAGDDTTEDNTETVEKGTETDETTEDDTTEDNTETVEKGTETDETTEDDTTEDDTETVEQVDPFENASYEGIKRQKARSYRSKYLGFKEDTTFLQLECPILWKLKETNAGYEITRSGTPIGQIVSGEADDTANWKILNSESSEENGISVTKHIERKKGTKTFRYRYIYEYTVGENAHTVTLTASYAELDATGEQKLCDDVTYVDQYSSGSRGVLSASGEPASILILGNSFISTSNIGNILREMLTQNGKACDVEAISRGYAEVETYASDSELLARIRRGEYDMVFICGFYDREEVENLDVIRKTCNRSNTQLVIFPAHNENAGVVAYAQETYPALVCLNWKNEIDLLIKSGVSIRDFCINDEHQHSTPLAGYVGAHMIYRAIYNELPTRPMRYALAQSDIDGVLGNYAYVGSVPNLADDEITYLD